MIYTYPEMSGILIYRVGGGGWGVGAALSGFRDLYYCPLRGGIAGLGEQCDFRLLFHFIDRDS